jgi:hypothetical protein
MKVWILLFILGFSAQLSAHAEEGELTQEQLATLDTQAQTLRDRAEMWAAQAQLICSKLKEPGDCGVKDATWSDCLNDEVKQIDAALAKIDEASAEETQELKDAKDKSQTFLNACPAFTEAAPKATEGANVLTDVRASGRVPYPGSTLSQRLKRTAVGSVGFVTARSWGELGVAAGGGAAAFGAYKTVDQPANDYFKLHPPSTLSTAPGDYFPYVIIPLYGITWVKKWFPDHQPGECPQNGCFSDRFKMWMDVAAGTYGTTAGSTLGAKYAFQRERPNATDKYSFWSLHSAFAADLAGSCHSTMDNWKFCLIFDAMTVATMDARVAGRWHFPSDTIWGATVGGIIGYWGGKRVKEGFAPKMLSWVDGAEHTTKGGTTFTTTMSPMLGRDAMGGEVKGASYTIGIGGKK